MLSVGQLMEGFVLDHIQAGRAMAIYSDLGLNKIEGSVAIIQNARSEKMGKKDIIKIEMPIDDFNLEILGFVDHNVTVNIVKDGSIIGKKNLTLPKRISNVVRCKNPRCISSIEQELEQVFILTDEENAVYRCLYCEEKHHR